MPKVLTRPTSITGTSLKLLIFFRTHQKEKWCLLRQTLFRATRYTPKQNKETNRLIITG